jgi:FKBP-type peptidyl-prolyl cis-trans isomerase
MIKDNQMKRTISLVTLLFAVFVFSCKPDLSTEEAKCNYGFGHQVGTALKSRPMFDRDGIIGGIKDAAEGKNASDEKSRQTGFRIGKNIIDKGIALNVPAFTLGLNEGFDGSEPSVPQQEMTEALNTLQRRMNEKNLKEGMGYLARNREKPDVKVTPSGLQYKVITRGNGPRPRETDKVKVHYTGRLVNGQVFDSSVARNSPAEFVLNKVVKGWTEGVQLMNVGSKYELTLHPELGYGAQGAGSIPGNSVLVFEVELLGIVR